MAERLSKEVKLLFHPFSRVHVTASPNLRFGPWKGAKLVAEAYCNGLMDAHVTKQEYDEEGPPIIHRKSY